MICNLRVAAVIAAGGKGRRMGAGINKVFLPLEGKSILARTVSVFEDCEPIDEIVIVTGSDDIAQTGDIVKSEGFAKVTAVVNGGDTRQESVYRGLCEAEADIVLIHDGARCLITKDEIEAVARDCAQYGAAAVGVTVKDTLKTLDESGFIVGTVNRDLTVTIRTPQAFALREIKELHERAREAGTVVTDDCAIFEAYGRKVHFTPGSYENIKITSPADLAAGERILKMRKGACERT